MLAIKLDLTCWSIGSVCFFSGVVSRIVIVLPIIVETVLVILTVVIVLIVLWILVPILVKERHSIRKLFVNTRLSSHNSRGKNQCYLWISTHHWQPSDIINWPVSPQWAKVRTWGSVMSGSLKCCVLLLILYWTLGPSGLHGCVPVKGTRQYQGFHLTRE